MARRATVNSKLTVPQIGDVKKKCLLSALVQYTHVVTQPNWHLTNNSANQEEPA